MSSREYFGQRRGLSDHEAIDFEMLKKAFLWKFGQLEDEYYFQGATGYHCVDNGFVRRKWGDDIETSIYLSLRMNNVWPISENIDSYDFVKLFTIIEFLYDYVSKPLDLYYHPWDECGWHSSDYDWDEGKSRYREEMNEILKDFENGYELNEQGEILELTPTGFETLIEELVETDDPENIDNRVQTALVKFLRYNASLDDKKEGIRILADVLEYLRTQEIRLPSRDDRALFRIINNFDIRHHNRAQQGRYNREVWYDWMFYTFLASINVLLKIQQTD